MKYLLALLLLLLPNIADAETWNCSYKSTEGPATGSTEFTRNGNIFDSKDEFSTLKKLKDEWLIAKENKNYIILVFQGLSKFVVELNKDNETSASINFIDLSDMAQWKGKCSVM